MNVLQSGESLENRLELLAKSFLGIFDLPSIEPYPAKKDFSYQRSCPITTFHASHHRRTSLSIGELSQYL